MFNEKEYQKIYYKKHKKYLDRYKKNWIIKNKEKDIVYKRKWVKNNLEYYRKWNKLLKSDIKSAYRKVCNALKSGFLTKEKCFCGSDIVEAHHEDYSKPLTVVWLCSKHHKETHKIRMEESNVQN